MFGSLFSAVVVEAEPVLRRWLLRNDDFIFLVVIISLFWTAFFAEIGLVTYLYAGKVLAILWGTWGLVLCLVMLTVLLTGKRGGET